MFRPSHAALVLLFLFFPILSEAMPISSKARSGAAQFRSHRANSTIPGIPVKNWTLVDDYHGEGFLENWDFFTAADPTHGLVNYQSAEDAKNKGLAFVQGNSLILAVDNTTKLPHGAKRDSVRISSKKKYNAEDGTLFIADFASIPASCGVWPAWWSVGPSWPRGGEIDVLEGVHKVNKNKMTLHTSAGCVVDNNMHMLGKVDRTNCASSGKDNQGCGVSDTDTSSYGEGFNNVGGGVYAHTWTSDTINIWHFAHKNVPKDISSGTPDPLKWPVPTGAFSVVKDKGCDFSNHFRDHVLTIDTTIGGDWAGSEGSLTAAHCPTDIEDIVVDPRNFDSARCNINYLCPCIQVKPCFFAPNL